MKILLLEDDLVDQMAFSRWVKKEFKCFSIQTADSVEETKTLLQVHPFDLLVVDYYLPDGNILDLLNFVDPKKIVCISGISDPKKIKELQNSGISHFFFKDNFLNYLEQFKLYILLYHNKSICPDITESSQNNHNANLVNLQSLKKAFDFNSQPIREIIEVFLDHTPKQLERLKEAVQNQNLTSCNFIAHQLKSSFQMMGLFPQMKRLEEIETVCCKEIKNQKYFIDLVNEIQQDSILAFDKLKEELKFL